MSTSPHSPTWTRADAIAAAVVAVCALVLSWGPLTDLDWGWHLATFERTLAEGRLPVDDTFAWGSNRPYEPVHLVFQLGVGVLHRVFGVAGVVVWRELLCLACGLGLWWALRRRGATTWTAVALSGVVLAGAEFRLSARPHLFTLLGLVLLLDLLLAWRDRGLRRPWALLPLFAVWANAHPAVLYGVLTLWGFAAVEAARGRRGLLPWALGGTLATFVNPLGPGLYPYLLAHRDMQRDLDIAELRGLFEHPERGIDAHVLLAGLFVLGVALGARRWRRLDPTLALASLAFAALGVILARSGHLALVVLAFALVPALPRRWPAPWGRVALGLALLVPAAAALQRLTTRPGGLLFPGRYAVRAADWLVEHQPAGRIYNVNALGGYLVYRLAPHGLQVHTDGRMPLFGDALREARDWGAFEARHTPSVVVLDWGPSPTVAYPAELDPGFRQRYALVHVSDGAKVYLRRTPANAALVEAYGYQELSYLGRLWAAGPLGAEGLPEARVPGDPARFAAEVRRARQEAPELRLLPSG